MHDILKDFAATQHLRLSHDADGPLIPGKHGHIYDWEDNKRLAVMVRMQSKRSWNYRHKTAVAAGLDCIQRGDEEGCFRVDPADPVQAKAAIAIITAYKAYPKRVLSPEQRTTIGERLKQSRKSSIRVVAPV